jgi:hypothetical protein
MLPEQAGQVEAVTRVVELDRQTKVIRHVFILPSGRGFVRATAPHVLHIS